jgi:iron(III) transport system substrate-binding protein
MKNRLSRRALLKASGAFALGALATPRVTVAAAPPAAGVTPELIAAAQKEGKVAWYTSVDLPVAEKVAKAFEAKHSGIAVRVERNGSERLFQRLGQEISSRIHAADLVNTSDGAHFVVWKRDGLLEPYLPQEVAQHFPKDQQDPDGTFFTWRASLSPVGYNTSLVKPEEAPKSFADLLDPKWAGKIVKGHPGYSGTIMTATFEIVRDLGWSYLEKLAKQRVMQVQSSTDPPKKLALGERAVMADGNEYNVFQLKEAGQPLEVVYPAEGTPLITAPNAIFKTAPNPNAAKLLQNFLFAVETQQLICDVGGLRSFHPQVKEREGRKPLRDIKLMKDDPAGVEKQGEEIKARYTQLFRV